MTIASPVSSASFQGNGVTLSFPLPFRFVSTADVTVVLRDAGGGESLLTETTDYTLSGAGEASGGVCVLAGPPLTGQTLVCTRDPRIVQETDYQENDAFPAESHEAALDLLTMICQALDERLGRGALAARVLRPAPARAGRARGRAGPGLGPGRPGPGARALGRGDRHGPGLCPGGPERPKRGRGGPRRGPGRGRLHGHAPGLGGAL